MVWRVIATAEDLAYADPVTTLGAQVLLEAAADILAIGKLDPEISLGEGPVFDIVVNVAPP